MNGNAYRVPSCFSLGLVLLQSMCNFMHTMCIGMHTYIWTDGYIDKKGVLNPDEFELHYKNVPNYNPQDVKDSLNVPGITSYICSLLAGIKFL